MDTLPPQTTKDLRGECYLGFFISIIVGMPSL